jgi:hypothetical protein
MSQLIEPTTAALAWECGYEGEVHWDSLNLATSCTQDDLAKWLREVCGQYVLVTPHYDEETNTIQFEGQCGEFDPGMGEIYYSDDHVWYEEWEDAMEAALRIGLHAIDLQDIDKTNEP